jgi:hypothetical protein
MTGGPVLIGGLAFTGKTPLRIALGLHPDLSMTRKTHLWDRLGGRLGDLGDDDALERALDVVMTDPGAARLEPDRETLRSALVAGPRTEAHVFGLLHAQHAARLGRPRWGEQLGPIVDHADALVAAFPDARIVHLVRDPVDRFAASPHRGPVAVARERDRWRRDALRALANAAAYPGRTMIVRTEDLAADPVVVLEAVCGTVALEPTPDMRDAIVEAVARGIRSPRRLGPASHAWIERTTRAEAYDLGYGRPAAETATAGRTR